MIDAIYDHTHAWAFIISGITLAFLELMAPRLFLALTGFILAIVGTILLFLELALPEALCMTFILVFVSILMSRPRYAWHNGADPPGMTPRPQRYIGKTFILAKDILDGCADLSIEGTWWPIVGPDVPMGTRVTVIDIEDGVLYVRKN